MAKALPSAQDLGVGSVQPSLAVASYKGATGGEDDAARGMYAAGGQFAAASEHIAQAQEKFDNLQAEDRFNQYQERLSQIALDPQTGWKNAKGEHALKGDFNKRYTEMFEDERKKLSETMESPGAKQRFAQLSASAAMRSRAALYEHSADQRMKYGAQVTDSTIKMIEASAWENYHDDNAFGAGITRAESVVRSFGAEQGASKETMDLAVREMNSRMWTNRIEAAVANGDTRKAKEMMGKVTYDKLLTTGDKEKLDAKIKPQIKLAEAQTKVDGIFAKLVAANPNAPFPALAVDAALRKEFDGDPEGLRFARQEADYRAGKIQLQQRESNHANLATVMQDIHEKKLPPSQLYKSPAYQALDGDQKARVIQHLDQLATSAASRAASNESRANAAEDRAFRARHRDNELATLRMLANPDDLLKMSPNEIAGPLALTIGPDNARTLLAARTNLEKPGKLGETKFSKDTFNSLVRDYGYEDPGILNRRPKNEKERETQKELGNLWREGSQLIEQKTREMKRPLTQEETEAVFRDGMKRTIKVKNGWLGGTKEIPSLLLPGADNQAERALLLERKPRVSIETIAPETLAKYIAKIKEVRPTLARQSDAEIIKSMRSQLERAEGARLIQGGPEGESLIVNILSGGD